MEVDFKHLKLVCRDGMGSRLLTSGSESVGIGMQRKIDGQASVPDGKHQENRAVVDEGGAWHRRLQLLLELCPQALPLQCKTFKVSGKKAFMGCEGRRLPA